MFPTFCHTYQTVHEVILSTGILWGGYFSFLINHKQQINSNHLTQLWHKVSSFFFTSTSGLRPDCHIVPFGNIPSLTIHRTWFWTISGIIQLDLLSTWKLSLDHFLFLTYHSLFLLPFSFLIYTSSSLPLLSFFLPLCSLGLLKCWNSGQWGLLEDLTSSI